MENINTTTEAEQFVNKYPAMFTEDKWFWIQEIDELLKKIFQKTQNNNVSAGKV